MKKRIPYSQRIKQELEEVLIQGQAQNLAHPLDAFVRQGARLMFQRALEVEMDEFLGRAHYQRGGRRRRGWRNGYEIQSLKSPMGILTVGAPQARATEEPFYSRLLKRVGDDPTDALSRLSLGMYVRGMSDRDVEDLWVEAFGRKVISKSGASELAKQLGQEFEGWRRRDLSNLKIVYLFLDGLFLALRQGTTEKEGVLAAYGITAEGRKVLLHLALGARESYADWLAFLQDLISRNLADPLLVLHDGRPGLIRAVKEVWPKSFRQACQVHKMRNILSKLPKKAMAQMKKLVHDVFWADDYETGLKKGEALVERFKGLYPSAMECLAKDLPASLTYLKFPEEHAKVIRTTNLMERTFGEARRRTKVIPRFPTEGSGLSLVFAVLVRASAKWRGVRMTPKIREHLENLRGRIQNVRSSDMAQGKIAQRRPSLCVEEMPSVRDSEKMHLNSELVEVR
jgi:transposase-like protein